MQLHILIKEALIVYNILFYSIKKDDRHNKLHTTKKIVVYFLRGNLCMIKLHIRN